MKNIINLLTNNKIKAFLLILTTVTIFISLISYNKTDPSFNLLTDERPQNLLSYFGAYLSDFMYQIIGLSAFLIPTCMFFWSFILFRYGGINFYFLRVFSLIISIFLFSTFLNNINYKFLLLHEGGIIGIQINKLLTWSIIPYIQDIKFHTKLVNFSLFSLSLIMFALSLGFSISSYKKAINHIILLSYCAIKAFVKYVLYKIYYLLIKLFPDDEKAYYPSNEFSSLNEFFHEEVVQTTKNRIIKKLQQKRKKIVDKVATNNANASSIVSNNNTVSDDYIPDIELLDEDQQQNIRPQSKAELAQNSEKLLSVLKDFGVKGDMIGIQQGPVVTMYELEPAAGTKSSRVIGLSDDIARSLSATSARISVVPGKNALGIELPNKDRMFFRLKELVQTPEFQDPNKMLPLILGKDLNGNPMVADLAKMPHLLVAGTTGSGKSVAINAMIMSLLYRYKPNECRMIMIDPKMLELSAYNDIPHLMTPVVTEPSKAVVALKWAVKEMENRYRLMSNVGVRNIANYNSKIEEAIENNIVLERKIQTGFNPETGKPVNEDVAVDMQKMPFIVVIVDEMADLMLVAGKDIESSIQRLAQMARAAGIHIIMATQRPSVDVITGVIKANFPSRISFKVTSKIDSRTILGEQGAEQLLGKGDMLYMGNSSKILRVHGPFVDDHEVMKVTDYLRSMGEPEYVTAVTESQDDEISFGDSDNGGDDLYSRAVNIVKLERKSSISYIQRSLRIGYNRAANLVEEMERNGVLSAPNHSGKREILLPED